MKEISMNELKYGDIFTYQMKLHGRKAYRVIGENKPESKTILCTDRQTGEETRKSKKGKVILLRNQS